MTDNESLDLCIGRTIMDADLFGLYDISNSVFHYTSPEGLLGILREDGPVLWFSQYDSLNDTTEGIHAIQIYQSVCDELVIDGKIDSTFYQAVRSIKPTNKEMFLYSQEQYDKIHPKQDPTNVVDRCQYEACQKYVCCFSKNRDSLPMWNYYTKSGKYEGYNIGLSFRRTRQSDVQNYYGKGYRLDLYSVIYDDYKKKDIIRTKIEELYSFCKEDAQGNDISRIQNVLSFFLKDLSLKFKQDFFKHEDEVRFILTIPESCTLFKLKYRSNAGYIIPYIEVPFPKEVVSGITVGPLLNDKTAVENIRQFAKDHGYLLGDKDIKSSEIPIRY